MGYTNEPTTYPVCVLPGLYNPRLISNLRLGLPEGLYQYLSALATCIDMDRPGVSGRNLNRRLLLWWDCRVAVLLFEHAVDEEGQAKNDEKTSDADRLT